MVVVRPSTSSNLPTNRPTSLSKHKKPPADSINTFAEGSQINQQCHPSLTSGLKASQVHTVLRKSNYAVPLDWSGLVRTGCDWSGLVVIGWDWLGLVWIGPDWFGLVRIGWDWLGLVVIDWDWPGLVGIGLDWSGLVGIGPVVHRIGSGARENCASCSDFIRPRRSREKKTTVQWLSGEFNFKLYSYLCFETKSYLIFTQIGSSEHPNYPDNLTRRNFWRRGGLIHTKSDLDHYCHLKVWFRPGLPSESLILWNLKKVSRRSSWRVRW